MFETRGINEFNAHREIYDKMIDQPPGIYCMEIINSDPNNYNRSYASFKSTPSDDIVNLPINVFHQLKCKPTDEMQYNIRIVKPPKAKKVYLRCLLNKKEMVKEIEKTFTNEINVHRFLSVGQIIIIESDITLEFIPFLVEKCEPSNVVDTTDVDVEVDFLPALDYDNGLTALLIELNK